MSSLGRRRVFLIFVLSLLWIGAPPDAYAQSEPVSGYILTADGDTTRGVIENRRWQRPPEEIRFAKSRDASFETLDVSDIAGFGVSGYVFERHIVDVDRRPVELNKPYPSDSVTRRDTLFLQRLVDGPITLYHGYTRRPHYFVETHEAELTELVHYLRPVGRPGVQRPQPSYYFREQLRVRRTEACADASVSQIDYSRKELVEFVASCNPESGGTLVASPPRFYRVSHVFSLRASRTASRHSTAFTTGSMVGVSPGLQYQLLLEMGETNPNGGLLFGVGIQRMRASAPSEFITIPTGRTGTLVGDLTATVLDLSTELRLRLTDADWRPFVGAEAVLMFPLSYEATYRIDYDSDRGFNTGRGAREWDMMQFGAGGGVGVEGPRLGARLGLLYGFPVQHIDGRAPRQLNTELQLFLKF